MVVHRNAGVKEAYEYFCDAKAGKKSRGKQAS